MLTPPVASKNYVNYHIFNNLFAIMATLSTVRVHTFSFLWNLFILCIGLYGIGNACEKSLDNRECKVCFWNLSSFGKLSYFHNKVFFFVLHFPCLIHYFEMYGYFGPLSIVIFALFVWILECLGVTTLMHLNPELRHYIIRTIYEVIYIGIVVIPLFTSPSALTFKAFISDFQNYDIISFLLLVGTLISGFYKLLYFFASFLDDYININTNGPIFEFLNRFNLFFQLINSIMANLWTVFTHKIVSKIGNVNAVDKI